MGVWAILLIGMGLAMDAFAVSCAIGLKSEGNKYTNAFIAGSWFGLAQAGMNVLGWLLGSVLYTFIARYGYYIAFFMLVLIGAKMLKDARSKSCTVINCKKASGMAVLAIATSIDAFAVGFSFSSIEQPILLPAILIGLLSFLISGLGVLFGNAAARIRGLAAKADVLGGLILIGIGLHILIDHLTS